MDPAVGCPDPQSLARWRRGELPSDAASLVAAHVTSCSHCGGSQESIHEDLSSSDDSEYSPPPLPLIPNDPERGRLGSYRIIQLLGRGGMGVVFEAEDERLGRRVALKIMLPEVSARDGMRQRFLREAHAAARVVHDHIVDIYEVNEWRGLPFLIMPLLVGGSLEVWLRKHPGPVPLECVLRWGQEIAEGLQAAHACGLVHRDIKPANIWIDEGEDARARILDFGLARISRTPKDPRLTPSGIFLGTPSYIAPEQARGAVIDGRADLFSLGVVLYRMTTGSLPFLGSDPISILMALAMHNPPPPTTQNPGIPESLSALIMRMLEKDPDRRPTSAQEVATRLLQCLEDHTQTFDTREFPPLPPEPTHGAQQRPRWFMPLLAGGAIALLGAVLLLTFLASSPTPEPIHSPLPEPAPEPKVATFPVWALAIGANTAIAIPGITIPRSDPVTLEAYVTSLKPNPDRPTHLAGTPGQFSLFTDHQRGERWTLGVQFPTLFQPFPDEAPLRRNQRIHLAGVRDGVWARFYVGGKLVSRQQLLSDKLATTSWGFYIGANEGNSDLIDHVRISSVARYQQDFTPPLRLAVDDQTLALFPLQEGEGDSISDVSVSQWKGLGKSVRWVRLASVVQQE